MEYNFKQIESKWQNIWYSQNTFAAKDDYSLPKYYCLVEFPYPSGQGLHVGHPRSYTALDIVARKKRLEGYNVLYPMGWDAFGLPTENFAIKNHIHPAEVTKTNIAHFKQQLQSLGFSFDWTREINTTDPSYYKWTQWIFLQLYKKGLAYKKKMAVNWCTSCKCVLANEEVVNGVCERCGSEVIRKEQSQWMLKITDYADRLVKDLDTVDFIDRVKVQQRNWIGRSTGERLISQQLSAIRSPFIQHAPIHFSAQHIWLFLPSILLLKNGQTVLKISTLSVLIRMRPLINPILSVRSLIRKKQALNLTA